MKDLSAPSETRSPNNGPDENLAAASALLSRELSDGKALLGDALIGILKAHTPHSFFGSLSPRRLADWVIRFLDFLAGRSGDVAVRFVSSGDGDRSLLLANSADAPFLLDSVQNFLKQEGINFLVVSHPILAVRREKGGGLSHLEDLGGEGRRESFLILEIAGVSNEDGARLEQEVSRIIGEVLQVQGDQKALRQQLKDLDQAAEIASFRDFWHWLQEENFLPFASLRVRVTRKGNGETAVATVGDLLGPPLWPEALTAGKELSLEDLPDAFRTRLQRSGPVVVEEIDRISPVYRAERLVYLGFREAAGEDVWVEHAFLGLFSQKSLDEPTSNIPALRRRIEKALETLRIPRDCHDFRQTVEIFNTFPKAELFFIAPEELVQIVGSFTLLYRQGAVKVVAVRSLAVQGMTLLVIMPREYHTLENMSRIETYLQRHFQSASIATKVIHIAAEYLSLHVSVNLRSEAPRPDLDRLERGLSNIARPWEMKLQLLLRRSFGERKAAALWEKYRGALSREYRALTHPRFALRDIGGLEEVLASGREVFTLWGPLPGQQSLYRLQFYSFRESTLNDLMPFLENLNLSVLDEVDFNVRAGDKDLFIKSFAVRGPQGSENLAARRSQLLEALTALRREEVENDFLHRLLLPTGLSWKADRHLPRLSQLLLPARLPLHQAPGGLRPDRQPGGGPAAVSLFRGPLPARSELGESAAAGGGGALPHPPEAGERSGGGGRRQRGPDPAHPLQPHRLHRAHQFLSCAASRDDYFFAFKISAIGIIDMPAPRPLYEIYVHSAAMEGIHLRGGKVARGGIRWSDRPDDFRTEILGLMKTQMTKNALIVPVGSKGGFVVKTPFSTREEGAPWSRPPTRR